MVSYFLNLTIELHVLYVLNTHIKFYVNWMLFTIRSINLFLGIILYYKNLKFKHLVDNIVIDLRFSRNFTSMEVIRRECNLIVDLLKFSSNKKILSGVVVLSYNQVCCQTLSLLNYLINVIGKSYRIRRK